MIEFTHIDARDYFIFGYVIAVDPQSGERFNEYQIRDLEKRIVGRSRDKEALRRDFMRVLRDAIFQRKPVRIGNPINGSSVEVVVTVNGFGEELSRYYQIVDGFGTIQDGPFNSEADAEVALRQRMVVPDKPTSGGSGPAPRM